MQRRMRSGSSSSVDSGGGRSLDDGSAAGLQGHALRFDKKTTMAESAGHYDSFDPLKHGEDESRALAKIKERERAMLSMKAGTAGDESD